MLFQQIGSSYFGVGTAHSESHSVTAGGKEIPPTPGRDLDQSYRGQKVETSVRVLIQIISNSCENDNSLLIDELVCAEVVSTRESELHRGLIGSGLVLTLIHALVVHRCQFLNCHRFQQIQCFHGGAEDRKGKKFG